MSSEVNPQEVVDVVLPGGGLGRTTRDHAARAGYPIVREDTPAPAVEVEEVRVVKTRKPRTPKVVEASEEADENTD